MSDFTKQKPKTDEWFTPECAITPILKHIPKGIKIIWCPFDKKKSHFVTILKNAGYSVTHGHIDKGKDFFNYEPKEWDMIISNPPFSLRNEILQRAFGFNKPLMLLQNSNGLFDHRVRYELLKKAKFTLLYLKGRVNYMRKMGVVETSSPSFQSCYVCNLISSNNFIFEEMI